MKNSNIKLICVIGIVISVCVICYSVLLALSQAVNLKYWFDSALSDTEQLYCSVIRGFVYYCQSLIIFSLLQVVLFSLLLKRIHKISYLIKESNATE